MRCSRLELLGCGRFKLFRPHCLFSSNLFRRLVLSKALEGALPHHSVASPTGELNLGDQLRLDPGDVFCSARRAFARERALVGRQRDELLKEPPGIVLVKAGSHPTRMDEVITSVHTDQKRTQITRAPAPTTDHHFLATSAFGLKPGVRASRAIRCCGAF